jgi:hypothetical protein
MKHLFASLLCLLLPASILAQAVPPTITYQGRVLEGTTPATGTRNVVFRIYNAASNGTRLYSEQQTVTLVNGEFSALLGGSAPTPVFGEANARTLPEVFTTATAGDFYLGVTIDNGTEIAPRQRIVTTPLAFRAQVAEGLSSSAKIPLANLDSESVGPSQLETNAVTNVKIADGAVNNNKLAADAVKTGNIFNGTIDNEDIKDGTIEGGKIAANAIGTGHILTGNVTGEKIAANSIDNTHLKTDAVRTGNIANLQVTKEKLADNSVDSAKIQDLSVSTADLASGAVDGTKMAPQAIGFEHLNSGLQSGIPKPRQVYNQAVKKVATGGSDWTLIPIDIEALAWGTQRDGSYAAEGAIPEVPDPDGCRINIVAQHRSTYESWRISDVSVYLEQPNFTLNPNFPSLIWGRARWVKDWIESFWTSGVTSEKFRLNVATVAEGNNYLGNDQGDWVRIYTYYPGGLTPGASSPYNVSQDNRPTVEAANGPELRVPLTGLAVSGSTVTISTENPHGIKKDAVVYLSGTSASSGSGANLNLSGGQKVTAVPTPYSLQFTPAAEPPATTAQAPASAYSISGSQLRYRLAWTKFRLWAAVHPDVSARIIVSDR